MHFSTPIVALAAILGASSAAPSLRKRGDTCTIIGVESDTQTTCGGVSNCISAGGTLALSCSNGITWNNGGDLPNDQTVSMDDTGLAYNIDWKQDWSTGGYDGCTAGYNGWVYTGVVDDPTVAGIFGETTDTDQCSVTFPI